MWNSYKNCVKIAKDEKRAEENRKKNTERQRFLD